MPLHPALKPVSGLIGTWRGAGRGEYPTIDPFEYTEEVTFAEAGKPFLVYVQKTWSPEGTPMHTETGYLRVCDGSALEFVFSQPTGQTELAEGTLIPAADGFSCELHSRVMNSASAKQVDKTRRTIELAGNVLTTSFAMAAVGVPMTHHLASEMRRAN